MCLKMKKLSIKGRVTLWYTSLMLLLVVLVLAFLLSYSDARLVIARQDQLVSQVGRAAQQLAFRDGELAVNPEVNYYQQGVYILVYTGQGRLIEGRMPHGFGQETTLVDKQLRQLDITGEPYFIYDEKQSFSGAADVWIRGITAAANDQALSTLLQTALVALPFLLVLAALGGYQVTRRAFLPVEQIRAAADRISEGSDLSQRINLAGGADELSALAATFDNMLARLQEAFAREKQLTADASHELRTPVAVIMAQCEYVLEQEDLVPEQRQALAVILRQAGKMSSLINQMMALARADLEQDKPQLEAVNYSQMLEIIAEGQEFLAREKEISFDLAIQPGVMVWADQTLLTRLVINLLDNAFKFTEPGGQVRLSLTRQGKTAVLQVQDSGIGISEAELARIWQSFYRVDPARAGSGSGLGLAMVEWIARVHGGQLAVESQPGQGSCFTFSLPVNGKNS